MYKTTDDFNLSDNDECWVTCQDPMGEKNISTRPRKAIYRSEHAIEMGWDFEIPNLRVDGEVEITQVWKNKPKEPSND